MTQPLASVSVSQSFQNLLVVVATAGRAMLV